MSVLKMYISLQFGVRRHLRTVYSNLVASKFEIGRSWRSVGAMNIRMRKYLHRGEGAYGKVYRTREVCNQQRLVAVKKLNIPGDTESGIPAFTIREVALLRKIGYFNHPNIVKLLDVSAGLKNRSLDLTLVFEYRDQDLSTFLTMVPSTGLSLDKIKDVVVQLLQGLDFLHTNMLVHCDLKPENVLVSSRGEVKIAGIGLACIYTYHIALTPCVVTLWYRGP